MMCRRMKLKHMILVSRYSMSGSLVEPVVPAKADELAADSLDSSVITVCTLLQRNRLDSARMHRLFHKLKFGRTEAPGLKSRIMEGWKSIDGSIEGWKLVNGSMEVRP